MDEFRCSLSTVKATSHLNSSKTHLVIVLFFPVIHPLFCHCFSLLLVHFFSSSGLFSVVSLFLLLFCYFIYCVVILPVMLLVCLSSCCFTHCLIDLFATYQLVCWVVSAKMSHNICDGLCFIIYYQSLPLNRFLLCFVHLQLLH